MPTSLYPLTFVIGCLLLLSEAQAQISRPISSSDFKQSEYNNEQASLYMAFVQGPEIKVSSFDAFDIEFTDLLDSIGRAFVPGSAAGQSQSPPGLRLGFLGSGNSNSVKIRIQGHVGGSRNSRVLAGSAGVGLTLEWAHRHWRILLYSTPQFASYRMRIGQLNTASNFLNPLLVSGDSVLANDPIFFSSSGFQWESGIMLSANLSDRFSIIGSAGWNRSFMRQHRILIRSSATDEMVRLQRNDEALKEPNSALPAALFSKLEPTSPWRQPILWFGLAMHI